MEIIYFYTTHLYGEMLSSRYLYNNLVNNIIRTSLSYHNSSSSK